MGLSISYVISRWSRSAADVFNGRRTTGELLGTLVGLRDANAAAVADAAAAAVDATTDETLW